MTSLGYQVKQRKQTASFTCANDIQIGAYILREGEPVKAVQNHNGLFDIYVEWGDGKIASLRASDVNKIAGFQAVQ
jgi:hypothetical protein